MANVTANEVTLCSISHVVTWPGRSGKIFCGASEAETKGQAASTAPTDGLGSPLPGVPLTRG